MVPQVVKLNVGGTFFATSKQNLSRYPGTFLARLVSDQASQDCLYLDGAIFVDRNPDVFSHILDWLRGCRPAPRLDGPRFEQLKQEAAFYGLSDLTAALEAQESPLPELDTNCYNNRLQLLPGELNPSPGAFLILGCSNEELLFHADEIPDVLESYEPLLGLLIECISGRSKAAPHLIYTGKESIDTAIFGARIWMRCNQYDCIGCRITGGIECYKGTIQFESSVNTAEFSRLRDAEQQIEAQGNKDDINSVICQYLRQHGEQLPKSILYMVEHLPMLMQGLAASKLSALKCINLTHNRDHQRHVTTEMRWILAA